jgi:hypothetical protein
MTDACESAIISISVVCLIMSLCMLGSICRPIYDRCPYCDMLIRHPDIKPHPHLRSCPDRVQFLAAEVAWSAAHDPNDYDRIVRHNVNPIIAVAEQDPAQP